MLLLGRGVQAWEDLSLVDGGILTILGNGSMAGGVVTGGSSQQRFTEDGQAFGSGIFLQGNGTFTFSPAVGQTQIYSDDIADQSGLGGTGGNAGSWGLTLNGPGTLNLGGNDVYTGPTNVNQGTLIVNGTLPNSPVTMASGASLQGTGAVNATNVTGTIGPGTSLVSTSQPLSNIVAESIGTLTVLNELKMEPNGVYHTKLGKNGRSELTQDVRLFLPRGWPLFTIWRRTPKG